MTEQRLGLVAQIKSYPTTFWVANTMEIFERMAWYGFYAISSLYITGPKETGGLGFTSLQRGQIQAIVPFFLYLFPVLTGALADRYGYKKMFTIAYVGMVISYYLLGQATTMPTFLAAFMLVAVSAAIFKPVVVGTVARVTNASNSATAFGIFYMMVNIGGFVGPLVAGAVRGVSWDYVFIACSGWALVNLVIVLLFYRDPSTESQSASRRSLRKVLDDAVEVLGNIRFFIAVFVVLIALMIPGFRWSWFNWNTCTVFVVLWLALNGLWDLMLPPGSGRPDFAAAGSQSGGGGSGRPIPSRRHPLMKRMHCSNWRFALFLLIMSGFWTSFNQIFLTMPEYIRDYTETKPMVNLGRRVFNAMGHPEWIDRLAAIEEKELLAKFDGIVRRARGLESMAAPEPEAEAEIRERGRELVSELHALARNEITAEPERQEADALASTLKGAADAPLDALQESIAGADELIERVDRAERIRRLATDPGLTSDDHAELIRLVNLINTDQAKPPLEPIDLVDAARTVLQYKVRIQPVELGRIIADIDASPPPITDDLLKQAVETINGRLKSRKAPPFENAAELDELKSVLTSLVADSRFPARDSIKSAADSLSTDSRTMKPAELAAGVRDLAYRNEIWDRMDAGRQVNAEHIVNFDAGAIILLQVLVSFLMAKFHQFTTMIVGMVIAAVGIGLSAAAGGTMIGPAGGIFLVVAVGIVIFAIGEMMASPTSQEYVGRIAPPQKVATYMGYYFVAVALGNLFGGILSGEMYERLVRDRQRPDLLWLFFGAIMFATAIIFLLYDKFALPRHRSGSLTPDMNST